MSMDVDLVLSGGGVRGLAHIGVISYLCENGFRIRRIAGCSVGGVLGAMYASNQDVEQLIHFGKELKFYKLPDIGLSKLGLIKGDRIEHIVDQYVKVKRFEQLKIPLVVNATNISTGEEVVFRKGSLSVALRSSIAYPGMMKPKKHHGALLVDGGLVNPVPVSLLRNNSSRLVVISDVSVNMRNVDENSSLIDLLRQSVNVLQSQVVDYRLKKTPHKFVHLKPNVREWDVFELKNDPLIITRGYECAKKGLSRYYT